MGRNRFGKALLAMGTLSILLCGCKDAETDSKTDVSEGELQQISPLELGKAEKWIEGFSVSGSSGNMSVSISSEVIIPEVKQMSVAEIQMETLDEEYVKKLIEKLYGNQDVSEIDTETDIWKYYKGSYKEKPYELVIDISEYKSISFHIEDTYEYMVCPEEIQKLQDADYVLGGNIVDAPAGANSCRISETEAIEKAEELLHTLGWSEIAWEKVQALEWMGYKEQEPVRMYNGYYLEGNLGAEGLSYESFDSSYDSLVEEEMDFDSVITVCINDYGILDLSVQEPMHIVEVTENVTLLPLDTIKSIIRRELNDHPEIYLSTEAETWFTELELSYIRVKDKDREGYYSYVPAWRLSHPTGADQIISGYPVIINALDGSVIYLEDVEI